MNEALAVCLRYTLEGLQHPVNGHVDRRLAVAEQDLLQRRALEVLHDEVWSPIVELPYVDETRDVVARQPYGGARLPKKSLTSLLVVGALRRHNLHCSPAP